MSVEGLRPAAEEDLCSIAALEAECFSDAWKKESLSESFSLPYYRFTVAEEKGKITGYLISTHVAGEAELMRIAVASDCRRSGVGRLLMEGLQHLCVSEKTPEVFLEVRRKNVPAIALYTGFGFAECGLRKNYYHDPADDAVLMRADWS